MLGQHKEKHIKCQNQKNAENEDLFGHRIQTCVYGNFHPDEGFIRNVCKKTCQSCYF